MRHLKHKGRPANEAGFILPTAVIVLLILTLLIGAAITVAAQTSTSTTRDDSTKAALEAAEAGLQVASYRLSQLKPTSTQCINGTEKPESESACKTSAEPLGNDATFQYWTSLPYKAAEKCAGQEVTVAEIKSGATLRCVTSEGIVNGVTPGTRLRTLFESKPGEPLFTVKGITGLHEVKISGSVKVPAVVASNEKIIGEGSAAFEKGFELCPPNGEFKPKAGLERNASGVTVGGIGGLESNPSLEKTRSASECPLKASIPLIYPGHATAESNEDSRIGKEDEFFTEGKAANKFSGAPNYELKMSSNSKLTLGGSKYYLCSFLGERAAELKIPTAAYVEIFIDSPEDAEAKTKCKSGGTFETGEFTLTNQAKNPAKLLIVMYGKGPLKITRGATFEGSIYAPEAEVEVNGGTTFRGGIVANTVHITNGAGLFEWSEEVQNLTNGKPTPYGRKAWEQCTPGSGASEGC
jgi:Tfp pilus assembly protein PilX